VGERNRATIVEVDSSGLTWLKSSASSNQSSSCVEFAAAGAQILMRNSRDRLGPRLSLPRATWAVLVEVVHTGELDLTR
jgi:hypothetical protein